MPARFALRIALPAVSAALLLTAGLTMQTRASPIHDRVVVAPSAALATGDDRQLVRAADAVFVGRVDAAERGRDGRIDSLHALRRHRDRRD